MSTFSSTEFPEVPVLDEPRLESRRVSVTFGGVRAVTDVDFSVTDGEILGLIGPNGAGKTTLINALTGTVRPAAGQVLAGGQEITRWSMEARAAAGIVRTFQGARVFPELTVAENIAVPLVRQGHRGGRLVERQKELLAAVDLYEPHKRAGALPYGDQRRLSIARALALDPKVLMLDEPAAGMTEEESAALGSMIRDIRDQRGCAIVVVEHDMALVMAVCTRIHVLVDGTTLTRGAPADVRADPRVIDCYLGKRR